MPLDRTSAPLVSAWIGEGNYGDELMALGLRGLLHKEFGIERLNYYQAGGFGITVDPWVRVSTLRSPGNSIQEKILSYFAIPRHDLLLYGGGSIFHSENSIAWKHTLLRRYRRFKKNKPAGAVGISVGPFPTEAARRQCGKFFNELDFIVCRDAESASMAAAMTSGGKVSLCGDLALLVPHLFEQEMPDPACRKPDLVGMSFLKRKADQTFFEHHRLVEGFQKILDSVILSGKKVRLFTFCLSPQMEDATLNEYLRSNSLASERVEIYSFNGNVFETMAQCNECSSFISMRLHGLITAYILNIPMISIGYNPKNFYFMNMIGAPQEVSLSWETPSLAADVLQRLDKVNVTAPLTLQKGMKPEQVRKILYAALSHG